MLEYGPWEDSQKQRGLAMDKMNWRRWVIVVLVVAVVALIVAAIVKG